MSVFFKRKKIKQESYVSTNDIRQMILDSLMDLYKNCEIVDDAFVLKDDEIYVFADVISMHEDVVQILFQIHHELLDAPIMETTVALNSTIEQTIFDACQKFNDNVLSVYINAIHKMNQIGSIEGYTQERHYFDVFCSKIYGIGKKEGYDHDFWNLIKEEIKLRLGNKKVYWVKVFASKDGKKAEAEVWINGSEAVELSKIVLAAIMDWEIIGKIHTEKQYFVFIQRDETFEKSCFTKMQIQSITKKAIKQYEMCKDRTDHLKLRNQLMKWCGDDSLAYEIFGFLPELYCKYAYSNVEFGERLLVVQKNENTMEIYQSQIQSFSYVEEVVKKHFAEDDISEQSLKNVMAFSVSAKAINKAKSQDSIKSLFVPAMGYYVNEYYQMR